MYVIRRIRYKRNKYELDIAEIMIEVQNFRPRLWSVCYVVGARLRLHVVTVLISSLFWMDLHHLASFDRKLVAALPTSSICVATRCS